MAGGNGIWQAPHSALNMVEGLIAGLAGGGLGAGAIVGAEGCEGPGVASGDGGERAGAGSSVGDGLSTDWPEATAIAASVTASRTMGAMTLRMCVLMETLIG